MIPEKIEMLNNYSQEQYTQYLIGYTAACVDNIVKKPGFYIDKTVLKDIEKFIKEFFAKKVSDNKQLEIDNIPFPIAIVFNDDKTVLTVGYEMDGVFIESCFQYQITKLNKNQIN